MKKHDHRQSLWLIAGGAIAWCYQCGSWRPNIPGRMAWNRPSGIGGENPAMRDINKPTKTAIAKAGEQA